MVGVLLNRIEYYFVFVFVFDVGNLERIIEWSIKVIV